MSEPSPIVVDPAILAKRAYGVVMFLESMPRGAYLMIGDEEQGTARVVVEDPRDAALAIRMLMPTQGRA